MMRIIKDIFNLPALILHELSHIIIAMMFGGILANIEVKRHDKGHIGVLLTITGIDNKFVPYVAFAPILVPIAFFIVSFFNPAFLIYFPYAILNYKTTLPSPTDFKSCGIKTPKVLEV